VSKPPSDWTDRKKKVVQKFQTKYSRTLNAEMSFAKPALRRTMGEIDTTGTGQMARGEGDIVNKKRGGSCRKEREIWKTSSHKKGARKKARTENSSLLRRDEEGKRSIASKPLPAGHVRYQKGKGR